MRKFQVIIKKMASALFITFTLLACESKPDEIVDIRTHNVESPEIAILGVFHFSSTTDLASINMENILGEERQQEIKELIVKIEKFNPSKILVEFPYSKTSKLDSMYSKYVSNEYSLTINEIDQIGFRLAQNLRHSHIYGIDYRMNLPNNDLYEYCQKNNRMEDFEAFVENIKNYTTQETELLSKMTLTEYLAHMNTDKTDRKVKEAYLKNILSFGDYKNNVGANFSAMWFKRNLIILNNIDNVIHGENERVLVIIGSAHRAFIKSFIKDRNDMKYIEVNKFLD